MTPDIDPQEFFSVVAMNVSIAILCGGTIGLERQLRSKAVGLRVCMLVVLITSFFVTIGVEMSDDTGGALRVLSSVITGIGFLGAGVILSQGGKVQGITTATLIWALAGVGAVIGFGYGWVAILATLVVMGVLGLSDLLEYLFPALRRGSEDHTTR